ncbi:MAG: DUF2950 family protein [Planctomycetota bacterium]
MQKACWISIALCVFICLAISYIGCCCFGFVLNGSDTSASRCEQFALVFSALMVLLSTAFVVVLALVQLVQGLSDCAAAAFRSLNRMFSSPPPKSSIVAVASVTLGTISLLNLLLLSFCQPRGYVSWSRHFSRLCSTAWLTSGICAAILGIIAFALIMYERLAREYRGMSIWGIVLGSPAMFAALHFSLILPRSRLAANESATVGSLKTVATQQAIFKQQREVDQDMDGTGEYGFLGEMCGELAPRKQGVNCPVSPVYLSAQFCTGGSTGPGYSEKSGYFYRIYLAGQGDFPVDDRAASSSPIAPGPTLNPITDQAAIDSQEQHFLLYAWPVKYGKTGKRAFVVNEAGDVYATDMSERVYSGPNCGPAMDAAFITKGDGADGWFNDKLADGREDRGNDGNVWYAVER